MEEGTVTAIVLDHEQAHEEARCRQREQQTEPVAEIERCPHQPPEQDKRAGGDGEFDYAPRQIRRAIAEKHLRQAAGIGGNRGEARCFRAQDSLFVTAPIDDPHKRPGTGKKRPATEA